MVEAQRDSATTAWAIALNDADHWKAAYFRESAMDSLRRAEAIERQKDMMKVALISAGVTATVTVLVVYAVKGVLK